MNRKNTIRYTINSASEKARRYVLLLVVISPVFATAQRQKVYTNSFWFGHFSTIRLSDRFSINTDVQVRTRDWMEKWSQQLVRTGLQFKVNSTVSLTTGFAGFRHAVYTGERRLFRKEWRPWIEVGYGEKSKAVSLIQRFRVEERFMQKISNGQKLAGYDAVTRLRYRLELHVPLKGDNFSASLVNEIMVNPGKGNNGTVLDQNRTFGGLNVKVSPSVTMQFQYMKIVYWRPAAILEDHNVLRMNIQQKF